MKKSFTNALLLFVLFSCDVKEVNSVKELELYINSEKSQLVRTVESNDIEVRLTYRSTDLMVGQELVEGERDTAKVNSLRAKYGSYHYFLLSLSKDGREVVVPGVAGDFSELLNVLSFRIAEYVTLTTSRRDTIQVSDSFFNRTFGSGPSSDVLIVFEKQKTAEAEWMQFNLNEFGLGIGDQRFRFFIRDINRCPKVIF